MVVLYALHIPSVVGVLEELPKNVPK